MSLDMLSRFHIPAWSSFILAFIGLVVLVVHILAATLRAGTIGFVFLCCFFVAHSFHNQSLLSFGGAGGGLLTKQQHRIFQCQFLIDLCHLAFDLLRLAGLGY
jgi:hypothetical protein